MLLEGINSANLARIRTGRKKLPDFHAISGAAKDEIRIMDGHVNDLYTVYTLRSYWVLSHLKGLQSSARKQERIAHISCTQFTRPGFVLPWVYEKRSPPMSMLHKLDDTHVKVSPLLLSVDSQLLMDKRSTPTWSASFLLFSKIRNSILPPLFCLRLLMGIALRFMSYVIPSYLNKFRTL